MDKRDIRKYGRMIVEIIDKRKDMSTERDTEAGCGRVEEGRGREKRGRERERENKE